MTDANTLYQESGNGLYVVKFARAYRGHVDIVSGWSASDSFKMTFGSNYKNLSQAIGDLVGKIPGARGMAGMGSATNNLLSLAGINITNQFLTAQAWSGTNPPEFSINVNFIAYNDSYKDVVVPVTHLLRLTLPEELSPVLVSVPGPTVLGQAVNRLSSLIGTKIDLPGTVTGELANAGEVVGFQFGKWFRLSPIVIRSVAIDSAVQYDKDGNPIRMMATIAFAPFFTPYKNNFPLETDTRPMAKASGTLNVRFGNSRR